jgi:hypothetical protein
MSTPLPASPKCSARTRIGLWDVANEMDQEDGLIWVYGPGDDSIIAFTDFGIETLTGLLEIYKVSPQLLKRSTEPK